MACFAFKLNDIFQTNTNTNIYINKSSAAAASNIFFLNLFQCVQKLLVCQLFYKINGLCTQIFQKDVFSPGFLCFAIRGMQSVSFNRGRKKITVFVCVKYVCMYNMYAFNKSTSGLPSFKARQCFLSSLFFCKLTTYSYY